MLKKINSSFILKKIFIYLDHGIKLNIIRFNKRMQNKLGLNIIDYRRLSGKYRIIEENDIIKDYHSFNNNLLFEGHYSNGEKNGKGKEYNIMKIINYYLKENI